MSGSIIPISDEQAKLGQEILKTLRGLGSFIEKALGSTPEDLIAYFGGDRLRVRRAENLVRLLEETRRRLADWNVDKPTPASLSVAIPILRNAADEDREELVDLWARLFANAMDPKLRSVRYSFIEAVKAMDPPDVLVMVELYKRNLAIVRRNSINNPQETTIHDLAAAIHRRPDDVEASLRHLSSMGFFDHLTLGHNDWSVNVSNRELMRACYPEIAQ